MANTPGSYSWAYWVSALSVRAIYFGMAIYKSFAIAHDEYTPRVLVVLLRDSVAYFGAVVGIILANMIIWLAARVRQPQQLH